MAAAKDHKPQGRTPLMAGNWKMNLDHQQGTHLVQKLAWTLEDAKWDPDKVEVAVLPPYTDLRSVQTLVDGDKLSAEVRCAGPVAGIDSGAYTGEVSGQMLAKIGCSYVVVGHSERREYHAEDDHRGERQGEGGHTGTSLTPILCVGEGLEVRREGRQVEHTLAQLDADLGRRGPPSRTACAGGGVRAGLGDRDRRGGHPGRTRRRSARRSGDGSAELYSVRSWRPASGCSTAGR